MEVPFFIVSTCDQRRFFLPNLRVKFEESLPARGRYC